MAVFYLANLIAEGKLDAARWLEFVRSPSLYAGVYELPVGTLDPQQFHDEDELYFIFRGSGTLRLEGEDYGVSSGAIIYVPAGLRHRFHSITENLKMLVLFSTREVCAKQQTNHSDYIFRLSDLINLEAVSDTQYREFLWTPALSVGIYELPANSHDPQHPHTQDEIYFVLSGFGVIAIDGQEHDIGPGAIIYVPAQCAHKFLNYREDLRLLVFFSADPAD